jgi:uncharacterized protein (TIGR02145 family)
VLTKLKADSMKKIIPVFIFLITGTTLHCQEKFIDSRDGNVYKTINIQGTTWMAENLRFRTSDGSFYFDKDPVNARPYGILYDWKTATKVCPVGWHLPSGNEFQNIVDYNQDKNSWRTNGPGSNTFDLQLAGMQDYEGTFTEMDESAYFWTATEYNKQNAEYFSYLLITDMPVVDISRKEDISDIHGTEKTNKYSVRCVKN